MLLFWTYTSYGLTLITNFNSNVLQKLGGVTMENTILTRGDENIILTRGDYVDLLINGQVIGLGRVESTETTIHYGGQMLNVIQIWFW